MRSTGEIIKQRRIAKSMNVITVANMAGVTQAYVSNVEAGRKPPSEKFLDKLIETLELSQNEVMEIKLYELCKKKPKALMKEVGSMELIDKLGVLTEDQRKFVTEIIETLIIKNHIGE